MAAPMGTFQPVFDPNDMGGSDPDPSQTAGRVPWAGAPKPKGLPTEHPGGLAKLYDAASEARKLKDKLK